MDLVGFIKSKLSEDSPVGTLARDIQGDLEFPINKNEHEIIPYIDFKTRMGDTNETFQSLLRSYEIQLKQPDSLNLDAKFSVLYSEEWQFYKENFKTDRVILIGWPTDYYKVYALDSQSRKALFFDIKSDMDLNHIGIVDEISIPIGDLTSSVNIHDAISLLNNCIYSTPVKPNTNKFKEMLAFLELNL